MANKKLSAVIQIGGAISSSLTSSFGKGTNAVNKLGDSIKQLKREQDRLKKLGGLQERLEKDTIATGKAYVELNRLRREVAATDGTNSKLNASLKKAEQNLYELSAAEGKAKAKLLEFRTQAKAAGHDVDNLTLANKRLGATLARAQLGGKGSKLMSSGARRMESLRSDGSQQLFGSMAMALPFVGAAKATADFDRELQLMANTAEMSDRRMKELRNTIIGLTTETNQDQTDLLGGLKSLIAAGMDEGKAVGNLKLIGKTATATGAEVEDLSRTVFSLSDNLKVANSDMAFSLDILAKSGKKGNFELSDMAKEFPKITAMAAALKLEGTEGVATLGAALEIARKGAGTGEEAANNLVNFLAKIRSPQTLKKFKKFGVDINAIIEKSIKSGGNPLEAAILATRKVSKGGDEKILGTLFEDMQVKNFIRPMIQHWDEYKNVKESALGSKGTVDKDFDRMMKTNAERFKGFVNQSKRLGTILGDALGPTIDDVVGSMKGMADWLEKINQKNPGLVGNVVRITANLILLNGAIGTLKWVIGSAFGPLFKFGGWLFELLGPVRVGTILSGLGRMVMSIGRFLPAAITLGSRALGLIPGWGWAIMGVVTVVGLLIANWDKVGPVVKKALEAMVSSTKWAYGQMKPMLDKMGSAISGFFGFEQTTMPTTLNTPSKSVDAIGGKAIPPLRGGNTYTDNSKFNFTISPGGSTDPRALAAEVYKHLKPMIAAERRRNLSDSFA